MITGQLSNLSEKLISSSAGSLFKKKDFLFNLIIGVENSMIKLFSTYAKLFENANL